MAPFSALLALLAAGPAQVAPAAPALDAQALGRQHTAQFYAGELEALWEAFTPELQRAMKSQSGLAAFREQVRQLGAETEVVAEGVTPLPNQVRYRRSVRTEHSPVPLDVVWTYDMAGRVAGFYVAPQPQAAASRHERYMTRAALRLPFEGEWTVAWGGRSVAENYHAATQDQRYATDLVVVQGGKTHRGDGQRNEDYFAYDRPLFAPAAGTVVAVVDGIPDNPPGEMNRAQAAGNHVVIDHGHGEFSLLAHFRPGSLQVKPGQAVAAGQLLGRCGNSGNSSEPHLHYHLQTSPTFGRGEGLPAQFRGYVADGERVPVGEPRQGQVVRPE